MNPPRKLSPRNTPNILLSLPRNHRESVVTSSSVSRRRDTLAGSTVPAEPACCDTSEHEQASQAGGVAALKLKKKKTYLPLSNDNPSGGSGPVFTGAAHGKTITSGSSRRHASTPQPRTATTLPAEPARIPVSATPSPSSSPISSLNQAHIDIANDHRARARSSLLPNLNSPPIVDFTRFEDTYRGPRFGTFEGLVSGTKTRQRSVSAGYYGRDRSTTAAIKMKDRYPVITPSHAGEAELHHPASTPAASLVPGSGGLALAPASARKPDPRRVLSALEGMLGDEYKISDHLHAHELLGTHQLDQLDFEERDRARATFVATGKLNVRRGEKGVISVLGEPIRTASIYSSVPVVLSGREHEIPIVVVNTVEELYRTGIYQANLFRHLPNRGRLMELINIYDSEDAPPGSVIRSRQPSSSNARIGGSGSGRGGGDANRKALMHPGFGAMTSLHLESTPDVCALLTTYISSLREPILCRFLFGAIWDWCGVVDEFETEEAGSGTGAGSRSRYLSSSFAPRLSSIPLARTYTSPEDASRIATAQLLLHLLPSAHFSLLVYLLAFFSQVALVREENGVGVADLARMYGARIFGGDNNSTSPRENTVPDKNANCTRTWKRSRDGETMMRWFLRRWGPLSDGLFDVLEDANMGLFRRTQARRDSFGKDILSSWSSIHGSVKGEEEDEEYESVQRGIEDDAHDEDESLLDSLTVVRDRAFGRRVTPAARATREGDYFAAGFGTGDEAKSMQSKLLRAYSISDRSLSDLGMNAGEDSDHFVMLSSAPNQGDDTLDISRLPPASKGQIKDSGSSDGLDERLLDLSMSELMNETRPFTPDQNDRDFYSQLTEIPIPEIIINSATPPNHTPPQQQSQEFNHLPAPVQEIINGSHACPRSPRSTIITPLKPIHAGTSGTNAKGELENSVETMSKLKEENAMLHNTVWRLETELAQVRRDFYAAGGTSSRAPAAVLETSRVAHKKGSTCTAGGAKDISLGAQDAEAVRIVAEIRRLMAKN